MVKPGEEVVFLPTHTASNPCTGKAGPPKGGCPFHFKSRHEKTYSPTIMDVASGFPISSPLVFV